MSDNTLTLPFTFTTFNAVAVKKVLVPVPADRAADFANIPPYLASDGVPNTFKFSVEFPTAAEAELFRDQLRSYAEQNDLNAYLPVFVPGHWSRKDADPETGVYTINKATGEMGQAKWIEPSKVDPTWNVGTNVTFRLTFKKQDDNETPAVDTATVTTTQGTPRAPRARSRGQQIINR